MFNSLEPMSEIPVTVCMEFQIDCNGQFRHEFRLLITSNLSTKTKQLLFRQMFQIKNQCKPIRF